MFKQEYIDPINEALTALARETKSLFEDGNETDILLMIEKYRKCYLYLKERGAEVSKQRNLKQLREYSESADKTAPKLPIHASKSKGTSKGTTQAKKPVTKDEKLATSLESLGLNAGEFLKRLKGV